MACLGSVLYDPATAATASTASLLAMTAFDTTNMRITFTAPANGTVMVRIRVPGKGATSQPMTLLGVLDGATVKGRQAPAIDRFIGGSLATFPTQNEVTFLVTGLTAGTSYTWDAAYAVQVVQASTAYGWGGPDNTTASDAYGAFAFDIWETPGLLAGKLYDPAAAVTSSATAVAAAMVALDTTNLRLNFNVPASGKVLVRLRCNAFGATGVAALNLGVLEGSTIRGRAAAFLSASGNSSATDFRIYQSEFVVGGLTPGANLNWDAAMGVETGVASTKLAWGGPNDALGADAYGGFDYEIWPA